MQRAWYLVATKPKQEARAKEHLVNQQVEFFLPEVEVEKLVRGKRITRIEPLFPGYLFILLSEHDPLWSKIRSTRGIRDFIRFSGKPAKVESAIVEHFRARVEQQPLKLTEVPEKGARVRIKDGPFKDLDAIFESLNGEERAIILLNILGKQQKLAVKLSEISVN